MFHARLFRADTSTSNTNAMKQGDLEHAQERDQIRFLLRRQMNLKTPVIEPNYVGEGARPAIVEIWRTGRQSAQSGHFHLSDVFPQAGNESETRVGGYDRFMCAFIA
jgi:hypothetical protein